MLFVDSSFWYALAVRRDPRHSEAGGFFADLDASLCTTTFVFTELASLLTKRANKTVAIHLCEQIRASESCEMIHPTDEDLEAAWRLFLQRVDLDFDLVDAISFTVMERLELPSALSFDQHFLEMGFEVLPR